MDAMMPWEIWVRSTALSLLIRDQGWLWPILETLHFIGLSVLVGTVGLFDLRVLGLVKRVPLAGIQKLLPLGAAAFVLNLLTGIFFFFGFPDQYAYNAAFQFKIAFMVLAGVNLLLFNATEFKNVRQLGARVEASTRGKLFALVSLASWTGVLVCGRLLTFFRPPFYH